VTRGHQVEKRPADLAKTNDCDALLRHENAPESDYINGR
jgi:hypothetical protein